MSPFRVSPEVALREAMIENQTLRNRNLILAQQVADRDARIAELEAKGECEKERADDTSASAS